MPYKINKVKNGYKVCKKSGDKCFSDKPLTKKKATEQRKALYANENIQESSRFDRFFYENYFPFEYIGMQEDGKGGKFKLFNALEDIAGILEGSTVSDKTIEKLGFKIPENYENKV